MFELESLNLFFFFSFLGIFQMGVGIWIIVSIIVIVLAIVIAYCIYQNKCKKESPEYEAPAEQDHVAKSVP